MLAIVAPVTKPTTVVVGQAEQLEQPALRHLLERRATGEAT